MPVRVKSGLPVNTRVVRIGARALQRLLDSRQAKVVAVKTRGLSARAEYSDPPEVAQYREVQKHSENMYHVKHERVEVLRKRVEELHKEGIEQSFIEACVCQLVDAIRARERFYKTSMDMEAFIDRYKDAMQYVRLDKMTKSSRGHDAMLAKVDRGTDNADEVSLRVQEIKDAMDGLRSSLDHGPANTAVTDPMVKKIMRQYVNDEALLRHLPDEEEVYVAPKPKPAPRPAPPKVDARTQQLLEMEPPTEEPCDGDVIERGEACG